MCPKLPATVEYIVSALCEYDHMDNLILERILREYEPTMYDLKAYAKFDHPVEESYGRSILYTGANFGIYVMSWNPGDFTAIHDHGHCEWGAVYFLGDAAHRRYSLRGNTLHLETVETISAGSIECICDDTLHAMGNLDSAPFLTLHVYGSNSYRGNVNEDAQIYELDKYRIRSTKGPAFLNISDEYCSTNSEGIQTDEETFADFAFFSRSFFNRIHNSQKHMNNLLKISIFLLIGLTACAQNAGYTDLNAAQFQTAIQAGDMTLIDVRTEGEYAGGHISGAGNINMYAPGFQERLSMLPTEKAVYLYCATGSRSSHAANMLIKKGYKKVFNLTHGMMEWSNSQFPISREQNAQVDNTHKVEPEEYVKLIQSDTLVFVDFYAPWCAPCRKIMPLIDSLKVQYQGKIRVEKVNADASKSLVRSLKMNTVPYFILYKNGQMVYTKPGIFTRSEISATFEKYLRTKQ